MDVIQAAQGQRSPGPVAHPEYRIDRIPLGLFTFGLTSLVFLILVWFWPDHGEGLWGPRFLTGLAWTLFFFHVALVRRHANAFDPIIWIPVLILLYHTGAAIAIEFLGSKVHTYDGLGLGWGPPRLHQTYGVIVLTLTSFILGTHVAGFRDARRPHIEPPPKSVLGPGLCLLIGGLLMSWVGILVAGPSLLFGDYGDQRMAVTLGLSDFRLYGTGNLFIQAGIFAVLASYDRRRPLPLWFAAFGGLYYAGVLFATGYRGHLSAFSFGTGWLISSRVRRLPPWSVVALFTTMLLLIPILREFRQYREVVHEPMDYGSFVGFAAQAFYEMGSATQAVAITIDTIPYEKSYDWGLSAVASMLSNIPNFGTHVQGWTFQLDPFKHLPSVWFTARVNPVRWALKGGGFAFAMAAEWYWNFGFLGIFLGVGWMGWMVTWMRNKGTQSAFLMAATSLWIAGMSINIRNAMGYPSRMFLWGFVGILVLRAVFALLQPGLSASTSAVPAAEQRTVGP